MKKLTLIILTILLALNCYSQTQVVTKNKLIINHKDITLYLDDDTTTLVSVHNLKYSDFLNIGKVPRKTPDPWFVDTYTGKYNKKYFAKTGYDLGHLTPFHITSYSQEISDFSFSLFNEAPQLSDFNEHAWEQLERKVQDTIKKYKEDVIIITGVVYNENIKKYLQNSKIKIPTHYYKILKLKTKIYCWIGDNTTGVIKETTLNDLNLLFVKNKINLKI